MNALVEKWTAFIWNNRKWNESFVIEMKVSFSIWLKYVRKIGKIITFLLRMLDLLRSFYKFKEKKDFSKRKTKQKLSFQIQNAP